MKVTLKCNKPFELKDLQALEANPTVIGLQQLVDELTLQGLRTTSHGSLTLTNLDPPVDPAHEYSNTVYDMRAWEYSRVFDICGVRSGMRVLDCGGGSSPLDFYMAKIEADVSAVDLQADLIENARQAASKMGWRIDTRVMDLTALDYDDETFDVVISVSVLEHMNDELKIKGIKEMGRVLKLGGIMGITFDFGMSVGPEHRPIRSLADIRRLFVEPSGLSLYGDGKLHATSGIQTTVTRFQYQKFPFWGGVLLERGLRWVMGKALPRYTFYSLFLEKTTSAGVVTDKEMRIDS